VASQPHGAATGGIGDSFVDLLPRILWCWVSFARAFLLGRQVHFLFSAQSPPLPLPPCNTHHVLCKPPPPAPPVAASSILPALNHPLSFPVLCSRCVRSRLLRTVTLRADRWRIRSKLVPSWNSLRLSATKPYVLKDCLMLVEAVSSVYFIWAKPGRVIKAEKRPAVNGFAFEPPLPKALRWKHPLPVVFSLSTFGDCMNPVFVSRIFIQKRDEHVRVNNWVLLQRPWEANCRRMPLLNVDYS
jgi:hypothetical protein